MGWMKPWVKHRTAPSAGMVGILLILWGCSSAGSKLPKSIAPFGNTPPTDTALFLDAPRVVLPGRRVGSILLPKGYVLESEEGALPEIHHVWRKEVVTLLKEVTLTIVGEPLRLAQCPKEAEHVPSLNPSWESRWRECALSVKGLRAREAFLKGPSGWIIQVVVIGKLEEVTERGESLRLQAIAESLKIF